MSEPIKRKLHYTDYLKKINPDRSRDVTRRISNWSNWFDPVRKQYRETVADLKQAQSIPDNWQGRFDFKYQFASGPLQIFVGDSTSPTNTALIGVRRSDKPGTWLNMKALGINPVQPVCRPENKEVSWIDLWQNSDLTFKLCRHKVEKIIKLKTKGQHPDCFRFTLHVPPGFRVNVKNNKLIVADRLGRERLSTKPVIGWDSATTGLSTSGHQTVRTTLEQEDDLVVNGKRFPVIKVTPNSDDLEGAIYPVYIDPTTTISGPTSIEDIHLNEGAGDANYGGWRDDANGAISGGTDRITLFRLIESEIPSFPVLGFRLYMYRYAHPNSSLSGDVDFYAIKDGNPWIEGTGLGGTQAAACWNYAVWNTDAWAGSVGVGTPDTDYVDDASPPTFSFDAYTSGDDYIINDAGGDGIVLPISWPTSWKEGTGDISNNEGIVLHTRTVENGRFAVYRSTETITNPENVPYFEIDYNQDTALYAIFV